MAISFEQMPEANRQRALEIFGQQMRGEITQAQAEAFARQNEAAAQAAVGGGGTTGGGGGGGGGSQPAGETCNGIAKPTAGLRRGWEYYCASSGWDTRWVGPGPEPATPDEERKRWEEEDKKKGLNDPSNPPAPLEGFKWVWNGTQWEAVEDTSGRGITQGQRESAEIIILNLLEDYGLGGLAKFVNDMVFKEDVMSPEEILARIRADKGEAGEIYRKRFAGNIARRNAGYNALSEADYVRMENTYRQIMRASGLPTGFYDQPDDFNALIGGDVSGAELSTRINDGYMAVQQSNPQVINEMRRLYGVDDSMLAAYFLDPDKATPMLLRQARAAQIAGEATLQAQRQIEAATAEELAIAGITQQQARAGFQTIAGAEELFVALPGTTEQAMTEQEQISGVFGTSAAAQQRLRQRQRERQATFEAGGRFAGQGTQVTGLQ